MHACYRPCGVVLERALRTNLLHVVFRLVVPPPCLIQPLRLVQLLHHILPMLSQGLDSLTMVLYLALQGIYLGFLPVNLSEAIRPTCIIMLSLHMN